MKKLSNKCREWSYTLTKPKAKKKVKRLTNKRDRFIWKQKIKEGPEDD